MARIGSVDGALASAKSLVRVMFQPRRHPLPSQTELVHFVRPSADLLFESVAATSKQRAIMIVPTGAGVDGNMGLRAMKKMGGTLIVQNE